MFWPSQQLRFFYYTRPTDMRKSFDGLLGIIRGHIREDLFGPHLFLFRNKSGDRIKVLYWDHDGVAIWYKRLEKGTFKFPSCEEEKLLITEEQFELILRGIDFKKIKKQKRFSLKLN